MSTVDIDRFFTQPILNSPYEPPARHWELDTSGQPTQHIIESRRKSDFISPIPKPKKSTKPQQSFDIDTDKSHSSPEQEYAKARINEIRSHIEIWRSQTNPNLWQVTPATAQLLKHWRHHKFSSLRPFFCQIEAVETIIWLTEVAPKIRQGKAILEHLERANKEANPALFRLALKLATGTGKTTVMAMLIAWQTVNSVRHPTDKRFTRGFLGCTPGLTIKDRLRILLPSDPENYYEHRESRCITKTLR